MICSMIVTLKINVPYELKTVQETKTKGDCPKDEIVKYIDVSVLQNISRMLRGVVCNNHQSNISAYKNLKCLYLW